MLIESDGLVATLGQRTDDDGGYVAAMDTFCAYQPKLEDVILPQTSHITAAVKQLLEY